MPQLIEVPGYGPVEFPDGMSDDDIVKAIKANELPAEPSTVPGAVGRAVRSGFGTQAIGKPLQQLGFQLQQPTTVLPEGVPMPVAGYPEVGLGSPLMFSSPKVEIPAVAPKVGKAIETAGEHVEEAAVEGGLPSKEAAKRRRADIEAVGETPFNIAQGAGGFGGQLAVTAVSPVAGFAAAGLGEAEGFREDAEAYGAQEDTQQAASFVGGALGVTTEYAPFMLALGRFRNLPGGKFLIRQLDKMSKSVKNVAEFSLATLAEALQEGGMQVAQNLSASDWFGYDPERDWTQDVAPATVEGGGAATVVVGISKLARASRARHQQKEREKLLDAITPPSPAPTAEAPAAPPPVDPYAKDPEVSRLNRHLAFAASKGHERIVKRLQARREERIAALKEAEEQKRDAEFFDTPAGHQVRAEMLESQVTPPSVPEQMEMTLDVFDSLPLEGTMTLEEAAALPAAQEEASILQRAIAGFRQRGIDTVTPGQLKAAMQAYLLPLNFNYQPQKDGTREILVTTPVNFTSAWANRFAQDGYFAHVRGVLDGDGTFTLTGLESDLFNRWSELRPETTVGPAPKDAAIQLRRMEIERDFLRAYAPNWQGFVIRGLMRDLARQGVKRLKVRPGLLNAKTQKLIEAELATTQQKEVVEGEIVTAAQTEANRLIEELEQDPHNPLTVAEENGQVFVEEGEPTPAQATLIEKLQAIFNREGGEFHESAAMYQGGLLTPPTLALSPPKVNDTISLDGYATTLVSPFRSELRKIGAPGKKQPASWHKPRQAVKEIVDLKTLRKRRLEREKKEGPDKRRKMAAPDQEETPAVIAYQKEVAQVILSTLHMGADMTGQEVIDQTPGSWDLLIEGAANKTPARITAARILKAARNPKTSQRRHARYPRPPSERWTLDPGAIPGEPSFYLDAQDGDLDTATHAIIETPKGKWELVEAGGRSLGIFKTVTQAAARVDPTSRATNAQQRAAIERVQLWARQAAATWPKGPTLRVVWAEEDVPGPPVSRAAGLYDPDTQEVWFIARNIPSKNAFVQVYLHEVAGHYGMQGILGQDFTPTMLAIYRTNPHIRERADAYREKYAHDFVGKDEREARALATEEALAHLTIEDKNRRLSGLDRMTAAIRSLLRKMGVELEWTNKDTAYLLASALRFAKTGKRSVFFSGQRGLSNADKTQKDFISEEIDRLFPPNRKLFELEELVSDGVDPTADVVFGKFLNIVVNLEQLAKLNSKDTYLHTYLDLVRDHNAFKSTWAMEMENRLVEIKQLSTKTREQMFEFALDVTVASSKVGRRLTDNEIAELAVKGQLVVSGPARQNMLVNAPIVSEGALRAYQRVDQDFKRALNQIKELMDEGTRRRLAGQNQQILEAALATNQQLHDSMLNRNYFPLTRFGDFTNVVIAREDVVWDGETYKKGQVVEVSTYEKDWAVTDTLPADVREKAGIPLSRNAAAKELAKEYPPDKFKVVPRNNTDPSTGKRTVFVPPALEQGLLDVQGLTPEMKQQIGEIFVDMMPSRAFAKRLKKQRKTIAGFSRDGVRAYADYFMRFSSYAANLKYADALDAAINEHRKLAPESSDPAAWDGITRWMADHKEYLLNPITEWATLRKLVSVWTLGLPNIAAPIVNLSQIPMFLYPYLASRYGGDMKALSRIGTGSGKIVKIAKYMNDAAVGASRIFESQRQLPDGLPQVLIELSAQQVLNQGFAVHMAGIADGALKLGARGVGLRQGAAWTADKSMWLYQKMEEINRRVTAAATFPLAMEDVAGEGAKWADLTEAQRVEVINQCRDAINSTQFDYSRANRPRFLRGRLGAAFIFFNFISNALFFLLKEPGRGRAWGLTLLMGGLFGIPGAEDLLDLIDALGAGASKLPNKLRTLFGIPQDLDLRSREAIKKFIKDNLPGDLSSRENLLDLVIHGAGSQYGLGPLHALTFAGIPIPKVDISASLSYGDILPGTKSLRAYARGASGEDMRRILVDDFANAGGAFFNNLLEAFTSTDQGIKGAYRALPKGFRKLYESYQAATTGAFRRQSDLTAYNLPKGSSLRKIDWTNPEDATALLLSGAGFRLSDITRVQAKDFALYEFSTFWETRKALRLKRLRDSIYLYDGEGKKEAIEEIKEFNKTAGRLPATRPYMISRKTVERSLGQGFRRRRLREATGAQTRQQIPMAQELYGEEGLLEEEEGSE